LGNQSGCCRELGGPTAFVTFLVNRSAPVSAKAHAPTHFKNPLEEEKGRPRRKAGPEGFDGQVFGGAVVLKFAGLAGVTVRRESKPHREGGPEFPSWSFSAP